MNLEVGFTTAPSRVFKGPAAIPVGRPKKQSGRFRLTKRPRCEDTTDDAIRGDGEGDNRVNAGAPRSEESLLTMSPSHPMLVLGLTETANPTIYVESSSSALNSGSHGGELSAREPLSDFCRRLVTSHIVCVAEEGSIDIVAMSHASSARAAASEELRRSRRMQRLREAMEMVVGGSLLGLAECGAEATAYPSASLLERAEVQGLLPALVFESLSLAKGSSDGIRLHHGVKDDPLLPFVDSSAYGASFIVSSVSSSSSPSVAALVDGLPLTFVANALSAEGTSGDVEALRARLFAIAEASRIVDPTVEMTVALPCSPSLQQRLFKAVHDVFKSVSTAIADYSAAVVASSSGGVAEGQSVSTSSATLSSSPRGRGGAGAPLLRRQKEKAPPNVCPLYSMAVAHIDGRNTASSASPLVALPEFAEKRARALASAAEITAAASWASTLLSTQLLLLAAAFRADQEAVKPSSSSGEVSVTKGIDGDVTIDCGHRRHRITSMNFTKLRTLFGHCLQNTLRGKEVSLAAHEGHISVLFEGAFHFRLFAMLERYFALSGCHPQLSNEGGWHAAVPLGAVRAFSDRQGIAMEAFASPLNTASLFFGSAFVDTDCFFGSVGSFFSVPFVAGAIEVNPPFDPTVAVQTIGHINARLSAVAASVDAVSAIGSSSEVAPLLFSVTIPTTDSTKTEKKSETTEVAASTDGVAKPLQSAAAFVTAVTDSPFLLAQRHLAGADAPYRDGNEFVSEGTHFVTRMGTLVAAFGAPVSEARKAQQAEALDAVADVWRSLCE